MRRWVPALVVLAACSKGGDAAPDGAAAPPPTTVAPPDAGSPTPDAGSPTPEDTQATTRWVLGRLTLPSGLPLRLLVAFSSPSGATLTIPLQGLHEGPLTEVALGDDALAFVFTPPGAPAAAANRFSGTRVPGDGPARWEGKVLAGGAELPVSFVEVAGPEAIVAVRPQTPKPPLPYATEEVRIPVAGAELGCTLSLPTPSAPLPAVLFLTGSGVQDRDETIFDHKPFFVLADALARQGIASLRCDDRGAGQSSGDPQAVDAAVLAADAVAALKWLRGRIEIDARRVGLLGHSEGGMTAAAVARDPAHAVAFVVTLAGPAVSGRTLLVRQNRDLLLEQGVKPEARDAIEKAVEAYFVAIEEDKGAAVVSAAAKALAETAAAASVPPPPGGPEQAVAAMAASFESLAKMPWLRGFLRARPAEDLAAAPAPVLALFGSKDVQVDAVASVAALEPALKATGKRDVEIVVVEGANHLFQAAGTGALAEYDNIEQTMEPATIERIVTWIRKQTGAQP